MAKREVSRDGVTFYKVKSDKVEIPDFATMTSIEVSMWMVQNTYARGHHKPKPNLAGLNLVVR